MGKIMEARCYILHSEKLNRFYIGVTTETIEARIMKHNTAEYGNHRFTSKTTDWRLFLNIDAKDYSHAVRIERKIKSMKSSKFIQNLKKYPELLQKTIDETKSI